jgi:hypothetical protein
MTTGATPLLSLSLPVEGELDGTWGDVVNYGITNYVDIAVAGTLTLTNDGAVTLDKTAGTAGGTNITSSLTGAGTVTAQFAVVKITGTLTTTKVVTVGTAIAPATSKTYIVDNAATGGVVTFKAFGQTGISIAVGEKCTVYFNGTDYVKVASTVADGVTSVGGTGTVNGITLTGTVTSTGNLTLGGALSGVNLASQVTGTLPIANGGTGTTSTTFVNAATNVTGTLPVANGGTGVTTSTGTGSTVLSASPTFTGTPLSTTAAVNTNTTQIATTAFVQTQIAAIAAGVTSFSAGTTGLTPSGLTTGAVTLAGTLAVANGGTGTSTPSILAGSNVVVTGTWPNQTISASGGGGGGTAGIFLAAASGALANGDKIVINADGTVSAVNAATQSAGSATNFYGSALGNTSNAVQVAGVYDSTNNKTVVAYIASSGGGYAVVGTVSGTSISFGTAVLFDSSATTVSLAFDSANSKIVISYGLSSAGGKAIIGTVSGTSISFGTAVSFTSNSVGSVTGVYDSVNAKVVISYRDVSTTYGTSIVGTVSGTSISFGTAVVFNAFQTYYTYSTYAAGKVVIAFADGANSYYGYAIVGTVSGTSISFGTKAVFNSATLDNIRATYDTTNSKVVIGYADIGNSNYGTASVGTISGTSISFGTKVVFTARYTTWFGMAYSAVVDRVMFACWDPSSGSSYGTSIPGAVSGTSISFTAPYVYNSVNTFQPAPVYDSTAQKLVIAYSNTTANTGAAQVVTAAPNMTATNFIGISDAAYASGAIATIQTVGSIDDAQTGLTAGILYYVQPNGTLASTAGSPSVVAGTAVSAVKLIIKG